MSINIAKIQDSQCGSALIYILIAIALLAALTASFMDSSSDQTTAQNKFNLESDIKAQANFIRSAIEECVTLYPAGDNNIAGMTSVGGHNPIAPYPLQLDNTYLPSPTPGSSLVKDIRCPGNPGTTNNHTNIFGGVSGKTMPTPPNGFLDWKYHNHKDGIYILLHSNKTDSYVETALKKVDAQYPKCDAQYIDARSAMVSLDADNFWYCSAGYQCLRIWVRTTSFSIFPGDTGCP